MAHHGMKCFASFEMDESLRRSNKLMFELVSPMANKFFENGENAKRELIPFDPTLLNRRLPFQAATSCREAFFVVIGHGAKNVFVESDAISRHSQYCMYLSLKNTSVVFYQAFKIRQTTDLSSDDESNGSFEIAFHDKTVARFSGWGNTGYGLARIQIGKSIHPAAVDRGNYVRSWRLAIRALLISLVFSNFFIILIFGSRCALVP